MTNDQPAFDSTEPPTATSQFVPEPPEIIDEAPIVKSEYPIHLKIEFDPLELGEAQDFSDYTPEQEVTFANLKPEDTVALPMEFLETPEGYTAPQFDSFDSSEHINQDLDDLFSELAETASGQSADIAVWCPWLIDASQN